MAPAIQPQQTTEQPAEAIPSGYMPQEYVSGASVYEPQRQYSTPPLPNMGNYGAMGAGVVKETVATEEQTAKADEESARQMAQEAAAAINEPEEPVEPQAVVEVAKGG